jgi:hypothetical protein
MKIDALTKMYVAPFVVAVSGMLSVPVVSSVWPLVDPPVSHADPSAAATTRHNEHPTVRPMDMLFMR